MGTILAVGIATLDIINEVERYPSEDQEVRALTQSVRRGGNATNTLTVLSQLGHRCEWAGVLVDEANTGSIVRELAEYRIGTRYCRLVNHGHMPVSYITLSRSTATRTIVHYRDLPEYDYQSFLKIDWAAFDWIHFEGRNVDETARMIDLLGRQNGRPRLSLEVEKPRAGIERLFPGVDLLLFSRSFAESKGLEPRQLLRQVAAVAPQALLVCALGEHGAVALEAGGEFHQSPAFTPPVLVDTIGAGDTFNAGIIHRLLAGDTTRNAIEYACRLAGRKCGQAGLGQLAIEG